MSLPGQLYGLLAEFNAFGLEIDSDTRLVNDLGLDSLTMNEFLARIEGCFHITIADEEVTTENFGNVRSVLEFLEKKLQGIGL